MVSFSGCSLAPGMRGLDTSSLKVKPQKEGEDYKLVLIDSKTIKNQKPFDYIAYINEKKKRSSRFASLTNSSASKKPAGSYAPQQKNSPNKNINTGLDSNIINKASFVGITRNDVKAKYQYTVGKSDILSITVWEHPELTTPSNNTSFSGYVVDNDGKFYFPYTGKIQAAGKNVRQIRNDLESKLSSFFTKPQVTISVANYRSQKAYISGAVSSPAFLAVDDTPMTVRDAISKSGGVRTLEYTGYATLARNNKNISIDLNRMLKFNDNRQNFILKDGDRLHIIERDEYDEWLRKLNLEIEKEKTLNPIQLQFALDKERAVARLKKELERELKSEQAKVFVMGEVLKPGSVTYQVEDGMTLAEAINDAGSFKEDTLNPKGVFVVRKEDDNDKIPTVYNLPLASVQSMFFAEQFNVRPRDVVYVTATPSIRWNRVLNQLLPSLTLVNTFSNLTN